MRKIRIGLNGFGRIGRAIFRANTARKLFDVVAINDLNDDIDNLAYLMKYDSIHGILPDSIIPREEDILFNESPIRVFSESKMADVPWNETGVNVVVGCTGNLDNVANAKKCLGNTVQKVVFSDSPAENIDMTFVLGVNEDLYDPDKHDVIACSICDVVGSAPAIKKIHEKFEIVSGFMTSLHPWLNYQNIMDSQPNSPAFMDKPWTHHAIGRASIGSLIPKNTSLVHALERVLPELRGRLEGMSFRIPTDVVATALSTFKLGKVTTTDEVKEFLQSAQTKPWLGYTEEPLVSVDYKHNETSCMVDGKWIEVIDKRLLRLITWYDNEWGYSMRALDIIKYVSDNIIS